MERDKAIVDLKRASGHALKWLPLCVLIGAGAGLSSAAFLRALDWATEARQARPWLLYLLPAAGAAAAWLYARWGGASDRGHDLLVEQIHDPSAGVPRRMGPLVFGATVVTHLFGGSAGREGTAVQMGGAIASAVARALRLRREDVRIALMAGVAAGFGSVFGTPLAGTVFALEVLSIGAIRYDALFACLAAAVTADGVCRATGAYHTVYTIQRVTGFQPLLLLKAAAAGAAFGLAGLAFAEAVHAVKRALAGAVANPVLRPAIGGAAVILLTLASGTRAYLGLGVLSPSYGGPSILSAFREGGAGPLSWAWKLVFTAATVGSGFKGGEVTPLFFIGATLGNALSRPLSAPADLFAGLGLVAVFAGAANTPLACTLLGIELFGAEHAVPVALACFSAYLFSGHGGIYRSQKLAHRKGAS